MTTVTFDEKRLAVDKASWSARAGTWNAASRLYKLRAPERQRLYMGSEGRARIVAPPACAGKVHDSSLGLAAEAPPPQDRDATVGVVVISGRSSQR